MRLLLASLISGFLLFPGTAQANEQDFCAALAKLFDLNQAKCDGNANLRAHANVEESQQNYLIYFSESSTSLSLENKENLNMLVDILKTTPMQSACLKLVGHSDSIGSVEKNFELSVKRAMMVKNYIRNIYPDMNERLEVAGRGEEMPLTGASPRDPENRRVEILARDCG